MARGKVKPDELCKLAAIRVRLTEAERAALDNLARSEGLTVSELARQRLGLGGLILAGGNPGQAMAAR
jgi:hypothetical protein